MVASSLSCSAKNAYECPRELDDPVFTMACMLQFLCHDLILLKNQVPWMVLEGLFDMTKDPTRKNKSLTQLAIEFFSNIFSSTDPIIVRPIQDIKHILDLFRKWLVLLTREQEESRAGWQPMPCATSLIEAGIKFRRGESTRSIMDIKFIDGVLEIPPLLIQETTETVFRIPSALSNASPTVKLGSLPTPYSLTISSTLPRTWTYSARMRSLIID
jgi:hypothetical protein